LLNVCQQWQKCISSSVGSVHQTHLIFKNRLAILNNYMSMRKKSTPAARAAALLFVVLLEIL
jgi:hypothetical protein